MDAHRRRAHARRHARRQQRDRHLPGHREVPARGPARHPTPRSPLVAKIYDRDRPRALDAVAPGLRLDPTGHATPVDFGDVCINVDKKAFTALPPPKTLDDLTDPAYHDQLVVENPATSSTGL